MNLSGMLNDAPEQAARPSESPQQRPHPSFTRSSSGRPEYGYVGPEPTALSREASYSSRQSQGAEAAPKYASPYQGHQPSPGSALLYNAATQQSPSSTRSSSLPGPISTNHPYLQQPLTPSANSARTLGYAQGTPIQYASPTPSSQRSHTPGSVHHSPQAALRAPPIQHNAYVRASQPGMPLGPPPQRPMTQGGHIDMQSQQYHAQNAAPIHSSGAYHGNIDLLTRSPGLQREQQSMRSRGESLSVSPKTRLVAPVALHQSSNQSDNDRPNTTHMQSPPQHRTSLTNITRTNSSHTPDADIRRPPPSQALKRSSTMDLSTMMTPVEEKPSKDYFTHSQQPVQANHSNGQSVTPELLKINAPSEKPTVKQDANKVNGSVLAAIDGASDVKKRSAEEELDSAPPAKRGKKRKYIDPPNWAQRSKSNPYLHGNEQNGNQQPSRSANAARRSDQRAPVHKSIPQHEPNLEQPWLNPVPIDGDLYEARKILGNWEKSIKWNTPYPDLLRAVQDWFVTELSKHHELIQSPSLGSVEVEAKIGRLRRLNGDAANFPVLNMTLLDPFYNRDYRFESELVESDFINLNRFLNDSLVASRQEGRVPMEHKRVDELDSFAHLSKAAITMLPISVKNHLIASRQLNLRSTHDTRSGSQEATAQIVKVSLADLHIYNPGGYDCRISMNAEVNFKRPDIDIAAIIEPADKDNPVPQSRRKDRLSYRHLEYQFDLTKVNVMNMEPKYEMEVEVNARAIANQIQLMTEGKPHAFGEVVSGFLDNATFLMRQKVASNV